MGEIPNLRERATSAWRRDYDESHDGAEAEGVADRRSGNLGRVSPPGCTVNQARDIEGFFPGPSSREEAERSGGGGDGDPGGA
jgi:hypothetical protein